MLKSPLNWKALRVRSPFLILLCVSALWISAPSLIDGVVRAAALAGKPYSARRMAVMPEFYESVRNHRLALPEETTIAVVLAQRQAIDRAVFVNYYLYPRRVRFFLDLEHYRAEGERRPPTLLYLDVTEGEKVRWTTYDEVRREQLWKKRVISSPAPFSSDSRTLIIPLAASLDGKPPDVWATEAVFFSAAAACVTLKLHPFGESKHLLLTPNEPVVFADLVGEAFGGQRSGWIEVRSDQTLRAGAWLVNQGRRQATPLRIFDVVPKGPQRVAGGDRLWVVNVDDTAAQIAVDGRSVEIPPTGLVDLGRHDSVEVIGAGHVIPFSSRRDRSGFTTFAWPQDLP